MNANKIRLSPRDRKQLFAAATNEEWWVRTLKRPGRWLEIGYSVVLAGKCHRFFREELSDNLQRLLHTTDTYPGRVEGDAHLLVFGLVPASADAQFEAPTREEIERGDLLGEQHRVSKIVVEYKCPHTQRAGSISCRHQRRDW